MSRDTAPRCLYKYMSFETARIVLASGRLRWTTPPLLNDPYDLSFDLLVDGEPDTVCGLAIDLLWSDYLDDSRPAPQPAFELWKKAIKAEQPELSFAAFAALVRPIVVRSLANAGSVADMNVDLQSQLQRTKILCLTQSPDNILMWAHYGQQHCGAVFRFDCTGDDNAFAMARPVTYCRDMPRFADAAGLARMVAGRLREARTISDSQIYTKASAWSYEREWRIQFGHGRDPGVAFEDLRYGDEQLTGVVLGCRMPSEHQAELAALARGRNPAVELFRALPAQREFRMMLEPWAVAAT